jgi:hypothetical protein
MNWTDLVPEKLRRLQDDVRKNATRPKLSMKYEGGALRLTRTPGRQRANTPNTVSLEDLIHPNNLRSAFVYSFFIENDLLFQVTHSECPVPLVSHIYSTSRLKRAPIRDLTFMCTSAAT